MIELAAFSKALGLLKEGVPLVRGAISLLRGLKRRVTNEEKPAARTKWKPLFDQSIRDTHQSKHRRDVIVRDMRRIDQYPEIKETKGISSWFRVALLDTYHRGIELGLEAQGLIDDPKLGGWRFVNYDAKEEPELRVVLVGRVPFEQIQDVDWDGDEYYSYPHLYCHFDRKRQPYEKLTYCVEIENPSPGNPPYYREVADQKGVVSRSRKAGLKY